jgi:hypothetical protein
MDSFLENILGSGMKSSECMKMMNTNEIAQSLGTNMITIVIIDNNYYCNVNIIVNSILGISQVSDTLLKTFDNLLLQRNPHYR